MTAGSTRTTKASSVSSVAKSGSKVTTSIKHNPVTKKNEVTFSVGKKPVVILPLAKIADLGVMREVVEVIKDEVEAISTNLPEPTRNVIKCLPCDTCGKPISPSEVPVAIAWGEKPKGSPTFLGRPLKIARCQECDRNKNPRASRKPSAEAPATGKTPKTKGGAPVKASAGKLVGKIYRLVKGNPRKEGTHGHHSFSLIKDGMTVEDYIAAGGRNNDLRWDIDKKFVEVR